jgi:hypothetical protein
MANSVEITNAPAESATRADDRLMYGRASAVNPTAPSSAANASHRYRRSLPVVITRINPNAIGSAAKTMERNRSSWLGILGSSGYFETSGLMNVPAMSVPVGHACATFQQEADNGGLLFACLRGTATAAPRGLNGEVQGR